MKTYSFSTRLLSSLVHTEETNSNIASIYREKVVIGNKIHHIPAVHGNSIRGVLRRVGFNHLCETIELELNTLSVSSYHILFNGGMLDNNTPYIDIKNKIAIRRKMPLLSVLGSVMGSEMLQGKLIVSSAIPQCKELMTGDNSHYDMTNIVRYTRVDDCPRKEKDKTPTQMFYDVEILAKGAVLDWEIILDSDDALEQGALEQTLYQFSKKPFIGGASNKGHGKLEFEFAETENAKKYTDFLIENKEIIKKWIMSINKPKNE